MDLKVTRKKETNNSHLLNYVKIYGGKLLVKDFECFFSIIGVPFSLYVFYTKNSDKAILILFLAILLLAVRLIQVQKKPKGYGYLSVAVSIIIFFVSFSVLLHVTGARV